MLEGEAGSVVFRGNDLLAETLDGAEALDTPHPIGVEQSNVSIMFGDTLILKFYRRLRAGLQPEVEVAQFLTETAGFANTPTFLGSVEHRTADGEATVLAAAFGFVRNQGDAWEVLTSALARDLDELDGFVGEDGVREEQPSFGYPLIIGELLGRRTAELHRALAAETDDPAFAVEPITARDVKAWTKEAADDVAAMLKSLAAARDRLDDEARATADAVLGAKDDLLARTRAAGGLTPSGGRSRIHGDYHLGQVLMVQTDVMIIDFEGEPRRSLEQRRAKTSPLRDVAGMLRSIDYAAAAVLDPHGGVAQPDHEGAADRAAQWRDQTTRQFLEAYEAAIAGSPTASRRSGVRPRAA